MAMKNTKNIARHMIVTLCPRYWDLRAAEMFQIVNDNGKTLNTNSIILYS